MDDNIKFKVLALVRDSKEGVLGTGHNIILQYLLEHNLDIKTANTYINILFNEDWLLKNAFATASYNLSDKAIIWLNEYNPNAKVQSPDWNKRGFYVNVIGVLVAIIAILVSIIIYQRSVNNSQHNQNPTEQQANHK